MGRRGGPHRRRSVARIGQIVESGSPETNARASANDLHGVGSRPSASKVRAAHPQRQEMVESGFTSRDLLVFFSGEIRNSPGRENLRTLHQVSISDLGFSKCEVLSDVTGYI